MGSLTTDLTVQRILTDLEIEGGEYIATDEELEQLLIQQVAWMLDNRLGQLLSALYRMDVLEVNINAVLDTRSPVSPAVGIAHLILDRQRQRLATKAQIKVPPLEGEDW